MKIVREFIRRFWEVETDLKKNKVKLSTEEKTLHQSLPQY